MVMNKIFNFGKTSLYVGPIWDFSCFGVKECKYIPKLFYFDGGCYFKVGFYFFNHVFEFSRPKKDKTIYKQITKEELDEILNKFKREV